MSRDRVISMADLAVMEREAHLYATREVRKKRSDGRQKKKADRMADLRAWLLNRGISVEEGWGNLRILHNGYHVAELTLGGGRRAQVRQSGAGFYVAVMGTGARGRLTPAEVRKVIDALAARGPGEE